MGALQERIAQAKYREAGGQLPTTYRAPSEVMVTKAAPYGMGEGLVRGYAIGELPRLGVRQLIEGYNHFPWLRAVVDKISSIGASAKWTVYATKRNGMDTYFPTHPLAILLNKGNATFSGFALRALLWKHLLIVGEYFCVIERNAFGMPVALWPIPPHWCLYAPTLNEGSDDPKAFFQLQFRRWLVRVPARDMLHIYEPNPAMPYGRGSGSAMTLGDELETDEYAARFMKSFYYNSARPDILITAQAADMPIGAPEAERMEQRWMEKIGGANKAWKPLFLSGGPVTVTPLKYSQSELGYVDLRKFTRDVILQMYGMPPECLGVIENSNRSTIDAAEFFLTKHVVTPKQRFQAEALEHRLAPEFDRRLSVGHESIVQVDKETRLAIMKSQPAAFEIDQIRSAADVELLGPNNGGKLHILPMNVQLVDVSAGERGILPDERPDPSDTPAPTDADDKAAEIADAVIKILRRKGVEI